MNKSVLLPIAQGSEELEIIAVVDVLRRAGITVRVAGENEIISCSRRIRILPDILIDQLEEDEEFDAIVLPGGGVGVQHLMTNTTLESIIKSHHQKNKIIAAICAAPIILKNHKIINPSMQITCHPSVSEHFKEYTLSTKAVVVTDNIVTSRGAGTSIDFALALVELLGNNELASQVADEIVYKG